MSTVVHNLFATLDALPLLVCDRKSTLAGQITGPVLVSMGHEIEGAIAVGPDLPGIYGLLCWACCCFGYPCQTPHGEEAAKVKSMYNLNVTPKIGLGYSR